MESSNVVLLPVPQAPYAGRQIMKQKDFLICKLLRSHTPILTHIHTQKHFLWSINRERERAQNATNNVRPVVFDLSILYDNIKQTIEPPRGDRTANRLMYRNGRHTAKDECGTDHDSEKCAYTLVSTRANKHSPKLPPTNTWLRSQKGHIIYTPKH